MDELDSDLNILCNTSSSCTDEHFGITEMKYTTSLGKFNFGLNMLSTRIFYRHSWSSDESNERFKFLVFGKIAVVVLVGELSKF